MREFGRDGERHTIVVDGVAMLRLAGPWDNWDANVKANPCGHFGATAHCTCKIRDRKCETCGRVWVRGPDRRWYEVEDPHGKKSED